MVFKRSGFEIGDRVRLTRDCEVIKGTFTTGHEFKIVGVTERGYDLIDDNGEELIEIGFLEPDILEMVR